MRPAATALRPVSLAAGCARAGAAEHDLSSDPECRPRGHLPRRVGARPVPLARGRYVGRDRGLGRGAERVTFAHLETIPFRGDADRTARAALQLPEVQRAVPPRHDLFLLQERRPAEPGGALPAAGLDGAPEVLLDPEHALARRHRPSSSVSRCRTTASSPSTASRRAARTGRSITVLDVATKQPLTDVVEWVKVSGAAWAGDGFFYSRYPARRRRARTCRRRTWTTRCFYHRSARRSRPTSWCTPTRESRAVPYAGVTEDERFADPHRVGSRQGQEGQRRLLPRPRVETATSRRSWPRSATTPSTSWTTSATGSWCTPTARRPNGRVFLFDPKTPAEAPGRTCCPNGPSRSTASALAAASSLRAT